MSLCISIRFLTGACSSSHWHAHHSDGKVDLATGTVAIAARRWWQ